jgi:hypothetical protein
VKLTATLGTEDPINASVGLDALSNMHLGEIIMTALVSLASNLRFDRTRGDGNVPRRHTTCLSTEKIVLAYMSPSDGDAVVVPFSVIGFSDLLKVPAPKAFYEAASVREEEFGKAFLLAITICNLEAGIVELSTFTSGLARDHFLKLTTGSSIERSTAGSRFSRPQKSL